MIFTANNKNDRILEEKARQRLQLDGKRETKCRWDKDALLAHGFAVLCEIGQWETSPGLLLTFDIIL